MDDTAEAFIKPGLQHETQRVESLQNGIGESIT